MKKIYLVTDTLNGICHDDNLQDRYESGGDVSDIDHYNGDEKEMIEDVLYELNECERYRFSVTKNVYDHLKTIYDIHK